MRVPWPRRPLVTHPHTCDAPAQGAAERRAVAARLGRLSFTVLAADASSSDAQSNVTAKPVYAGEVSSAYPEESKPVPPPASLLKVFSGANKPEEYQF